MTDSRLRRHHFGVRHRLRQTVSGTQSDTSELRRIREAVTTRWQAGERPWIALAATAAVFVFWLLARTHIWSGPIDSLSVVRANQPLVASLLRVPFSLLVPALGLPVWGALMQVALVGSLGELVLGRRRLIGLAVGTQYVATMAGRTAAWIGPGHAFGLRPSIAFVRDTGPSAAVVAVGLAVACMLGVWRVAGLVVAGLLVEIVGLHTLAGREHLAAIAVGVAVGIWWRRRRRGGAAHIAGAVFALLGGTLATGLIDPTPVGRLQRIAVAFTPLMPVSPSRLACGIATALFLVIAASLRRGQRSAWWIAAAVAGVAVVTPASIRGARGASVLGVVTLVVLVSGRHWFPASADRRSYRRIAGLVATSVAAVAIAELVPNTAERVVTPAMTLGFVVMMSLAVWWATRPVREIAVPNVAFHRARRIVDRYGTGPLDYFALRDDKSWFFFGNSLVAYAVKGSVALVSPDPIGPAAELDAAWTAFEMHAADNGWTIGVLAASERWLWRYHEAGLRSMYIGDLAIVDPATFTLDGGERKGLRQAVNRIARNGYTVTFHDPRQLDANDRAAIARLLATSRRGEGERGFSMTLSRMFDRRDLALLIAVSRAPGGQPVAFCQFVPQAALHESTGRESAVGGWSLDVMRSERTGHPNGLLDHVIVETIRHLERSGATSLCLNFATMRGALADTTNGAVHRLVRRVLERAGATMQIESLWSFNAKFGPIWQPCHIVYPALADLPATAIAIARAESISELPLVGRFLRPASRAKRAA
jgi:lysyl-tRNA synthetase, class II